MRLDIELVPTGSWYSNLRTILQPEGWHKIREVCLARARGHCEICGAKSSRLECHEKWHYDDVNRIQTLEDIKAICKKCHQIKHIGRTMTVAAERGTSIDYLVKHFQKVNNCVYSEFQNHMDESFAVWETRNEDATEWELDISRAADYLDS